MSELTDREEDEALAAEYVLGLLEPEEVRAFEARLPLDPPFRAQVARWSEDLAALLQALPEAAPPPGAEAAILRRLFPESAQPWWRRLGLLPALAGGLAAALIVLWTTDLGLLRPEAPELAATLAAEDGSLVVAAAWDAESRVLTVERTAGGLAEGRSQELWLIAGEAAPVSLGLVPEAGEGAIEVPEALAALMPGGTLAITDEPPGGSPTGGPTGALLAAAPLAAL